MWSVTASARVGHWGRAGQVLIETLPESPEGPKHRSGGHWNKEHSQWILHCPDSVLVAGEELQAEWTHMSSVQTLWHHVHIHACLTPPSRHTFTQIFSKCIETKHFLSPKVQGTLLFYIHTDNQAKSLQQRNFLKRLGIVYRWKESVIEKGRTNMAPKHK